jgi:uncharacterized zinc-type alcohol dehydrogenase-like protein
LAVKFAVALGAEVTIISTSASKKDDAAKLGAHNFLVSSDDEAVKAKYNYFDVLLNTASGDIDYNLFVPLLKKLTGQFMTVSGDPNNVKLSPFTMLFSGCVMRGTLIGSPSEISEMLQFCADNKIAAQTEGFKLSEVNDCHAKCLKNEVRYRGVLEL